MSCNLMPTQLLGGGNIWLIESLKLIRSRYVSYFASANGYGYLIYSNFKENGR